MKPAPDAKEEIAPMLGPRLARIRLAYGEMTHVPDLTMADFAKIIGVEAERYRTWERGTREMPLWALLRLSHVTGCSIELFLAGSLSFPGRKVFFPDLEYYEQTLAMAQRIRWVRELREPDIDMLADVMRVSVDTWLRWETGLERPDMTKLAEFSQRFGVSLDFLWSGRLVGLEPSNQAALLELHPELRPPGWSPPYNRRPDGNGNNGPGEGAAA